MTQTENKQEQNVAKINTMIATFMGFQKKRFPVGQGLNLEGYFLPKDKDNVGDWLLATDFNYHKFWGSLVPVMRKIARLQRLRYFDGKMGAETVESLRTTQKDIIAVFTKSYDIKETWKAIAVFMDKYYEKY